MADNFYLEHMDGTGRWCITCGANTSADAQYWMRKYRAIYPKTALRVVERSTRRLIVCHDPQASREAN